MVSDTYSTTSCTWNEAREDTVSVGAGITGVVEVGLYDGVVLGEELEDYFIAGFCVDGIRSEDKAVFTDCYGLSGCMVGTSCASRVDGGGFGCVGNRVVGEC